MRSSCCRRAKNECAMCSSCVRLLLLSCVAPPLLSSLGIDDSSVRIRHQMSCQAVRKDQQWNRMGCRIEPRFVRSYHQRLLDQQTIRDVVAPYRTKISPVHSMAGVLFVFDNRRRVVDGCRSFFRVMATVLIVVVVGCRVGQCCRAMPNSR